ncbi:MAG TPA: hypothetical protein VLA76_03005 [Candidatus Angelobacter sp.]|nr:hypothetical protein [Candidatus Angelobacter sp.]
MTALGTLALASGDVGFFSPPPHRPGRPERRTKAGAGIARSLVRALRHELAHALDDEARDPIRVTTRYPY